MPLKYDDLKTTIETGNYWIDSLITREGDQWHMNYVGLFRDYISYSFVSYPTLLNISDYVNGDYEFLNPTQSDNVKRALAYITDLTGIEFVEVSESDADWHFFNGDYISSSKAAYARWQYSYNYSLASREFTRLDYDGVLIFDNAEFQSITQTLAPGSYGYELLLHELGHLLGLKHPFVGPVTLSNDLDSTNNTLMSYNNVTPYKTEFSAFDKAALLFLYGLDGLGGELGFGTEINMVVGTQFSEIIRGSDEVDLFIQISPNNDELQGGEDIDTAVYSGDLVDYTWVREGNQIDVFGHIADSSDLLVDVERLQFSDISVAFDLDGNAGKVAKLLGVMLGEDNWYNREYIGIGLDIFDNSNISFEAVMDLAFGAIIGPNPTNAQVVSLIYNNLVGQAPLQGELNSLVADLLDSGAYTQGSLGVLAAEHELNSTSINLVGLIDTGVEYFAVG